MLPSSCRDSINPMCVQQIGRNPIFDYEIAKIILSFLKSKENLPTFFLN